MAQLAKRASFFGNWPCRENDFAGQCHGSGDKHASDHCITRLCRWSILLTVMAIGYLFAYMQGIVHSTAAGEKELPELPGMTDFWSDIILPFLQLIGLTLICFGPAIIATGLAEFGESPVAALAVLPAFIFGYLYFPMAFLAVAMLDTVFAANPLQVIPSILRVPLQYLAALVVLGLVLAMRSLGSNLVLVLFPRGMITPPPLPPSGRGIPRAPRSVPSARNWSSCFRHTRKQDACQ